MTSQTKPPAVLAQSAWRFSDDTPAVQQLVRHPSEIRNAADLVNALRVPAIDWSKQMVVLISAGTHASGGYRVEIVSATEASGELVVRWKLRTPSGIVTTAFEHRGQVALLKRFDGPVRFQRDPDEPDPPQR
jgi:hypothetical protein